MYSFSFKCWAFLLSTCLAAFPLFAQDTAQPSSVVKTAPTQNNYPPAKEPSSAQIQVVPQGSDPDVDTEEIRLNPKPGSEQNEIELLSAEADSQEPDQATIMKDYLQGIKAGKKDSRGKPYWVLAGLSGTGLCICFGAVGIGVALAVPYYPPPPAEMLLGKSSKYVEGYFEGYTASIRWKNAGWATLGFLAAVAIDLALNYPITFGNIHVDMDQPE